MPSENKVGIVTVTFNSEHVLDDFLRSLWSQTHRNFSLYAVDNASRDASVPMLRRESDDRVRIIAKTTNVGVAEGNNIGIQQALRDGCEFILLLNNDVVFSADLITKLLEALQSHGCEMSAPKTTYFEPDKRLWWAGGSFQRRLGCDTRQNDSSMAMRAATADQESAVRESSNVQHEMLERLRQSPASGRIVLNLGPDAKDVAALPDIPLENGDRFLIPSTPDVVHVVGAVYNQASFLFAPESRVAKYLDEAGGPTRYADRKRPFVIRADGSVVSKGSHGGFLGEEFKSLRVFPGDTLVIPSEPLKLGRVRSVLDWSHMVSGFGMSATTATMLR